MRLISEATNRVTSQNFNRKFISIGRIVKAWDVIMGDDMADKATPNRILYRKPKKKTDKPKAVLEIAISQAHATVLHYQKDVILARIESVFGEPWINDIKFIAVQKVKPVKRKKSAYRPLTEPQKNHLSNLLDVVEDSELKERLLNLGQKLYQKANHES